MMVRFLSQDGNVMSEEFMGKTDRWDGFQGLEIISIIPREPQVNQTVRQGCERMGEYNTSAPIIY